jgi:formyl-CoA transferase
MIPFRPEAACPLDGIVVLDLSRLVAGNMLSLQLADFGAEVIKIEDPGKGDPLRDWRVGGRSLFWKVYARNKKSLTLDLKKPRARALAAQPRRAGAGADRELSSMHAREDVRRAGGAARAQ